jgi:hypothetical protein
MNRIGYWLVASDGGVFAFTTGYNGSIPGLGISPAGSGAPHSLNAPIVGMASSVTGHGYFMVASDGGSSPSVTPTSPVRVQNSVAVRDRPSPSCQTPAAMATGS